MKPFKSIRLSYIEDLDTDPEVQKALMSRFVIDPMDLTDRERWDPSNMRLSQTPGSPALSFNGGGSLTSRGCRWGWVNERMAGIFSITIEGSVIHSLRPVPGNLNIWDTKTGTLLYGDSECINIYASPKRDEFLDQIASLLDSKKGNDWDETFSIN